MSTVVVVDFFQDDDEDFQEPSQPSRMKEQLKAYLKEAQVTVRSEATRKRLLQGGICDVIREWDLLEWWRQCVTGTTQPRHEAFPQVACLVKKYGSVQVTSAKSERVFSALAFVLGKDRMGQFADMPKLEKKVVLLNNINLN